MHFLLLSKYQLPDELPEKVTGPAKQANCASDVHLFLLIFIFFCNISKDI